MSCLVFGLICSIIQATYAGNFTEIPVEIIRRIISWSPNPDSARIHPVTNTEYQEEIKSVHRLESLIYSINPNETCPYTVPLALITNLTQQLQLSQLYIIKRRKMTLHIANIFNSDIHKSIFRKIMQAFHFKSISISQFHALSFNNLPVNLSSSAKEKLKIFIGCCRALLPRFSTKSNLNDSYSDKAYFGHYSHFS